MRIRHRAREVRIYTREREQRISTSSTRVESTFSTCDSSSVSRIHCEDNYLGRSSYHHQQRTRESLFITRTNKPRITTLTIYEKRELQNLPFGRLRNAQPICKLD
ncbi:conserved hypothetical protein [Trichinella spiralis]|uniref:hypothetical protein n=1 Tax=Trichinella spiralis TaxID=6334 RepID=UPI0001EFD67C|nr:conserved hypothetical protein [Trichinella spiralis]